jgi:hypothetical protein
MSIFADDFVDMMADTITVERMTGRADDGVPTYAAPVSYRARVNYKTHNVLNAQNQLITARGMMWLDTVDSITVDDRITLPDGSRPVILFSNLNTDETGPAYTRVDFQ